MRADEFLCEAKVSIKDQILNDVRKNGGNINDYFVRYTDIDKLGYSAKQKFGRSPDIDDTNFSVDYIGKNVGKPALWFYPLGYYLKNKELYATDAPYIWLVKLKPNGWLQPVKRGDNQLKSAPNGKERVGMLRYSDPPAAIFFKPGYDVVGKYYDYAKQHKTHGQVKGKPEPSFFQKIRNKLI